MNITKLTIPKGIEYISDVKEIKEYYNNDLPPNCVISKQLTGVGGTSIVLTNDQPYIIAVHLIEMIICKVNQSELYPNVLGVYGNISKQEIANYVANGGKKIMVTYDSVYKVQEALGDNCKNFRLLVDEFHKMIAYLGKFKPSVCIKLLESNPNFKSVSYLTATPTDYEYLPEPMKKLNIIELDWEGKTNPNLSHSYIKEGTVERVLATLLDQYDNTTNEVYIFYNSRAGVVSLLKKLFKCKKSLTIKDINIMFSNNADNTAFFKKHLGNTFCYGSPPDGINNKRINIISSMGFEGIDYYPNHINNATPVSIIVSDPDSKSMRYDINVDVVQILGRFRKHKITNLRVDNPVIYLWNTQKSDYNLNEDEFLAKARHERNDLINYLEQNKHSEIAQKMAIAALKTNTFDDLIPDDNGLPMLHPYGIEAKMSAYKTMHSDSAIMSNINSNDTIKNDSIIVTKLTDLDPNINTYNVPMLKAEYTQALGRTPSVRKLIEEYESLTQDYNENYKDEELREECKDRIDNFLIVNPLFTEWLNSGITTAMMRSNNLKRSNISELAAKTRTLLCNSKEVKAQMKLEIDKVYTREELLEKVIEIYKSLNIEITKPKPTDIRKWYEIKAHSKKINNIVVSGYKIIKEIN